MPDTNDLHSATPLTYIARQYLSAALDMLPYGVCLATLVLVAGILPTVNAFALAALAVFVSWTVYVGIEFLREFRNHA